MFQEKPKSLDFEIVPSGASLDNVLERTTRLDETRNDHIAGAHK
jgi:hypothetical protein